MGYDIPKDHHGALSELCAPNENPDRGKADMILPLTKDDDGNLMVEKSTNPKDLLGIKKVPISLVPTAGVIHAAMAMKDGARKYGPYNWREHPVQAMVYIDATMRHLMAYIDGEDYADDSKAHHLGHAIACCAIMLDAMETGNLVDNRPLPGATPELLEKLKEND